MQYLDKIDDTNPENTTYCLLDRSSEIQFAAYTGKTAFNADEHGQALNYYLERRFLRKGFAYSIDHIDENVVTPQYIDKTGNTYHPQSKHEVRSLIFNDEIGISGFSYTSSATKEEKNKAFNTILQYFVHASKNLDFADEKNLFCIQSNMREIGYNNGGKEEIGAKDIIDIISMNQEKSRQLDVLHKIENGTVTYKDLFSIRYKEDVFEQTDFMRKDGWMTELYMKGISKNIDKYEETNEVFSDLMSYFAEGLSCSSSNKYSKEASELASKFEGKDLGYSEAQSLKSNPHVKRGVLH